MNNNHSTFHAIKTNVGQFAIQDKIFLIPEMNKIGCHLLASCFKGFGINAIVLETYKGLDLSRPLTSGKECYPCQITLGDILYFVLNEKKRLKQNFNPDNYIFFMPEATGPCRFGMYNKFQRIVLDSTPELSNLKIGSLTTGDSYSLSGIVDKKIAQKLRKSAYLTVIVGDILDRLQWRIRPYEKEPGTTDKFIKESLDLLCDHFENNVTNGYKELKVAIKKIIFKGRSLIDFSITKKPLIGIVGEIYVRTHEKSNQNLVRMLEKYGAEIVVSSISEWIDFTVYDNSRCAKSRLKLKLKQFRLGQLLGDFKDILKFDLTLRFQESLQDKIYGIVNSILDLQQPHKLRLIEEEIKRDNSFSFDTGTEAGLSISGAQLLSNEGCNGIVNVYPFTCMPGTIASGVLKPKLSTLKMPYLDAPFDGTSQPGWEAKIRTFVYQAQQHLERR